MSTPKDMPREVRGLWVVQYEPRERALLKISEPSTIKMWRKLPYHRKIKIVNNKKEEE